MKKRARDRWRHKVQRFQNWVTTRVPPGARLLLGVGLIVMGVFGVLPVLGFWMIPLGAAIAMLDLRSIWRWIKAHVTRR
ncbi:hypothetical protein SAMN04488042_10735 [Shimia aestuarii]|uniref:Transmembrane protein (PGPGW) n=1 Tax=Shimia aestuarii TaxID=254406 RepID=A0A1I4QMB2_9RHOB|nr:hypothetical protein SAMN04488042_10735 [Shimia aestuarii]